jgi:serine/threonine-protein kinase RsbW
MRTQLFLADFSNLQQMREFVAQAARDAGFDEQETYAVQLATDEAASNIIEHAYRGQEGGQIEITCQARSDGLVVILRDHGRSFDPQRVRPPNLKAKLSRRSIGGLGLYMIYHLMDEVQYQTEPGAGNVLTLFKRRGVQE